MMRESAGVASHTKGAGTGYDFAAAGEAIGQTTLSVEGGTVNSTGIKAGDVITKFGGRGIEDIRTLMVLIRKAKPGQQIPIVVVRDEKLVNLTATIQPRPVGK